MSELKTNLQEILQEKQEKIIPENIKKDVTIFDITGTYEGSGSSSNGNVKLFETVEEMQADENSKEGDLAVVYRSEIQNMTANTQTQYITFPETVTLPGAFESSVSIRLRAIDSSVMFDGNIQLSKTSFRFDGFSDNGIIRVEYTSTDGITYTRNTFEGDSGELSNPVDLGTVIHCEMQEEWNDNFGYFMQVGGSVFEGLFEYKSYTDSDIYLLDYSTLTYSDKININVGKNIMSLEKIKAIINSLNKKDYKYYDIAYDGTYYYILPYIQNASYTDTYYDITNNKMYFTISAGAQSGPSHLESPAKIYVVTNTFELNREIEVTTLNEPIFKFSSSSKTNYKITEINLNNNTMFLRIDNSSESIKFRNKSFRYGRGIGNDVIILNTYISTDTHPVKYKYFTAQNQLTAIADKVYNSVYYGKDGVNQGTLTQNVSNSFADINAEIYYNIQQAYNNMEPRVLTDSDKTIDKNIYFIPTKSDGTALLDTSNVTNMSHMFSSCINLSIIPLLNTSKVVNMDSTFASCTNLVTIAQINTSKATNMAFMFNSCTNLTTIPLLDTSQVTSMNGMFGSCTNLLAIPQIDTSKTTNMNRMFSDCINLSTISQLNLSKVTGINNMFSNCTSLSDDSLNNILASLLTATSYTGAKILKNIGLSEEQATTCTTLSNWSALEAKRWTTGY